MELIRTTRRIRCEMGACKNLADYSIKMSRVGVRSQIHICNECLKELGGLIKKASPKKKTGDDNLQFTMDNAQ